MNDHRVPATSYDTASSEMDDHRAPAAGASAHTRDAPGVDLDPRWTVRQHPRRSAVSDVPVFTVGCGDVAAPGVAEDDADSGPGILVGGVYAGSGPEQCLLEGPRWTGIAGGTRPESARYLDLYSGVLHRIAQAEAQRYHSMRFACADLCAVLAMRVTTSAPDFAPGPPLLPPPGDQAHATVEVPVAAPGVGIETRCLRIESDGDGAITAAAAQRSAATAAGHTLDRVVAVTADTRTGSGAGRAQRELRRAWKQGVDEMLRVHRAAWARRWSEVGLDLPGDPETELAVRFALFQLWSNAGAHGEAAVGARGLSGRGYRGHIFWDTDVFVLPAMVSMDPDAAAAMVEYRLRRLPAARERARADGCRGARFPWESAADGTDVTPRSGFLGGTPVPILTGTREEHITADVAWAADYFAQWTGRRGYLETTARDLLLDTARYWASRFELDAGGRAHLRGVIGPDEYHECVTDNAFTNVMARWNLRRAARLRPRDTREAGEQETWRRLADRIVDQLRPDGRYEQFTGYFDLEPLTAAEVAGRHVAADVLLGQQRVARSQLIKQPDVLMLHHMIPAEVQPGSLSANLDYYLRYTTHGSSLSPAIMATLLARDGRPDAALEMLRPALRMDLEDGTGTTASGLHMATLGGVWQAMLTGFAGVRVRSGMVVVRPELPRAWPRLGIAFRCLGRRVRLDLTAAGVRLHTDGPLTVAVGGRRPAVVEGESWWPATEEKAG
ncbi:glycoside hydrolase family 65 protein [Nocardia huaxiensis]|uniref:Glycoside hydrolase family 65 protein n=1 Tax=Nocardia huaxiensis TaxID=2755382 RepID=A0A7D6VFR2_9NOCA|nr:glycoside hydrolase family 65 protein [Nocardia huaxiensis]QLY28570.1 glycoside hydrolase family 65 protein [Nocardia huaxiensis]